jgi:hypothetical protein
MVTRRFFAVFAVALLGLFGAMIFAKERGGHSGLDSAPVQHLRFDARDRERVGEWYKDSQDDLPSGFQATDRLDPQSESRLRIGQVLDPDLRRKIAPVPPDLLAKLPAAPSGLRYESLDGHLVLLNERSWNVSDVLHFELDFGRP